MRKRLGVTLLAGSAIAATISLGTVASLAATAATWTVSPGGAVSGTASKITLTDTSAGTTMTCATSNMSLALKSGSGLPGTGIGSLTALSFSNCTGPLGVTFAVTADKLPWRGNALSYTSSSGVTHGSVIGIRATASNSSCRATVAGASATTAGKMKATFTNSTGKMKVLSTGGTLHIWNVQGCLGLVHDGDAATFAGAYTITPKQVITSP
jgi:hypothetical protein